VPEEWIADQSDLVVFVPGYTSPFRPIEIPEEQLLVSPEGPSIPEVVTDLGIAFATTSFASNGLITGEEAIPELLGLVDHFKQIYGEPRITYLAGFSLGSVATAQLLERSPAEFDGSLLGCGPLGDFQAQLEYLGDARVLFDYYFPEVLPGDLLDVPQVLREEWEETFTPRIEAAFLRDPPLTQEFLRVAQIPFDDQDLRIVAVAVSDVLFFNVFGLEDAIDRLGGSAYDNTRRWYQGSRNDLKLNLRVDRFRGDPQALIALQETYQTTGEISIPLVTIHTLGDVTVPYRQAQLFRRKIRSAGEQKNHRESRAEYNTISNSAKFRMMVPQPATD